jgi:hypothetical protein
VAVQSAGVIIVALVAAQAGNNRILGPGATNVYDQQAQPTAPVGTRVDSPSIHMQLRAGEQVQIRVVAGAGAGQIGVTGGIHGVEYDA